MDNIIEIKGKKRKYSFSVYPLCHTFKKVNDWCVIYIYLYNDNLIYCGKDSNFPSRLNYHKIYDKNILSKSNLIAVYYLNPQSISLAEVETDILEGNQFEINIHHNLK